MLKLVYDNTEYFRLKKVSKVPSNLLVADFRSVLVKDHSKIHFVIMLFIIIIKAKTIVLITTFVTL